MNKIAKFQSKMVIMYHLLLYTTEIYIIECLHVHLHTISVLARETAGEYLHRALCDSRFCVFVIVYAPVRTVCRKIINYLVGFKMFI